MRQPTPGTNIAPASEKDYAEVVALLEAASLPTEDLGRSSMLHFLVTRDGSGKVIGAIGVERYGRNALLRSWWSPLAIGIANLVLSWWRASKPAADLWRWRSCSY